MACFLYFIPGLSGPADGELVNRGLADVLGFREDGHVGYGPFRSIDSGPGGKPGVLLAAAGCHLPDFDAESQKWYPAGSEPDDKKYWFGFVTATPPTPDDLARDRQVPGNVVRLGDGRQWHVPIARNCPRSRGLSPEGFKTDDPLPQYQKLFDMALEVWNCYDAIAAKMRLEKRDEEIPQEILDGVIDSDREMEILVECLRTNYRLGEYEIRALGLFDDTCEESVLRVLIDFEGYKELVKGEKARREGQDEKKKHT